MMIIIIIIIIIMIIIIIIIIIMIIRPHHQTQAGDYLKSKFEPYFSKCFHRQLLL